MTATQQPDPFGAPPVRRRGPSGPRAGFWKRFGAVLVDLIVVSIVNVPFSVALSKPLYYAISIPVVAAYYSLLEGGPRGQTLGKMALGIRVIDLGAGGQIGYSRAFIRLIGRYASAIPLGLGYFWMLWDREKQTWHDKFAVAIVVPVSSYPVR